MTREVTMEDVEHIYKVFGGIACSIYNKGQECAPQLFMIKLGATPTDKFEDIYTVPQEMSIKFLSSNSAKSLMMMFIKDVLAHPTLAQAVVHISEAWTSSMDQSQTRADLPDSLEDAPNRGEAILVAVHTQHRSYIGTSRIKEAEDGTKSVTLEPLIDSSNINLKNSRLSVEEGQIGNTH